MSKKGKKGSKAKSKPKDEPKIVIHLDDDSPAVVGEETFDLSKIGTEVTFEVPGSEFISTADLLENEYSKLPSQQIQTALSDFESLDLSSTYEPVDLVTIGESIVLDDTIGNAWDVIKDDQSFQETIKSLSLQDGLQLEKDYWKTLLEDETTKFNLTLSTQSSFQDWVDENRDSAGVDWDELLSGSRSLDLDSLATATATAARQIHFFDGFDEDRRYLTLSDDGVLLLPSTERVESEKELGAEETEEETGKEVIELRPHLAAVSRQTQSMPIGLLRVAISDTESSLERYGLQIGIVPEPAARAVLQCIVDERVKQDTDNFRWNMQMINVGAIIAAAIIGAIVGAVLL